MEFCMGLHLPRTSLLLVLILLQLFHLTQSSKPPGESHVCNRVEIYLDNVEVLVEEPVKMKRYEWCVGVPPRCTKFTTELRNRTKHEAVEKNRTVSECCAGFVEINSECVPECPANHPCPNMKCQDTKHCFCLAGYTGLHCNTTCPVGRWGSNCTSKCQCGENNGNKCHHLTGKCILLSTTVIAADTTGTPPVMTLSTTYSPITVPTTQVITKLPSTEAPSLHLSTKPPSVGTITTRKNTPPTILTKLEDTFVNAFHPILTKIVETPLAPFGSSTVKVPQFIPTSDPKNPLFPAFEKNIPPLTGLEDMVNKLVPPQTTRKPGIDDDLIMREIAPIVEAVPTKAPKFDFPTQPTFSKVNFPKDLSPTLDILPKVPTKIDFGTTSGTIPVEDKIREAFSDIPIPFESTTKKPLFNTDWLNKEMEIGLKAVEKVFESPTTQATVHNILDKRVSSVINAFQTPLTVPHTLATFPVTVSHTLTTFPNLPTSHPTGGTRTKVIDKLNLQAEVEKGFKSVVSSVLDEIDSGTTDNTLYNVLKSLEKANSNAAVENHFTSLPTSFNVNAFGSNINSKPVPPIYTIARNEYSSNQTSATLPPVKLNVPHVIPEVPFDLTAIPTVPSNLPTNPPSFTIPTLPPIPNNPPYILTLPTLPPKPTYIPTLPPVPTLPPTPDFPTLPPMPTIPPQPTFIPTLPQPIHVSTLPPVPTSPPYIPTLPTLPPKPSYVPTLPHMPTIPPVQVTIPPFKTANVPGIFNPPDSPDIYTNPTNVPTNTPSLPPRPTFPVIPRQPPPIKIYQAQTTKSPIYTPENPVTFSTYSNTATVVLLDRSLFDLPHPTTIIPNTNHFDTSHSKAPAIPIESQNVFTSPPLNPLSSDHPSPPILHPAVAPTIPLQPANNEPHLKTPLALPPKELPMETFLPTPIIKERRLDTLQAEMPQQIQATLPPLKVGTARTTLKPLNPEIDKAIGVFENSLNDLMKSMEHIGIKKGNSLDARSKGSRFNNIQDDASGRELTDLRLSPGVAIREDENEFMSDRNYHPTSVGMNLIYNPHEDVAENGGPMESMHHLHNTDVPSDSRYRLTTSSVLPVTVSTLVLFLILTLALACYVFHRRRKPRLPCETCAGADESQPEDLNGKESPSSSSAQSNSNFCRFVNPHSIQLLTELQENQYQSPPTPQPIYEEIQW